MITISITTTESENPVSFEIDAARVDDYVSRLSNPNAVMKFTPRNGGVSYIPVRQITYLHVSEDNSSQGERQ